MGWHQGGYWALQAVRQNMLKGVGWESLTWYLDHEERKQGGEGEWRKEGRRGEEGGRKQLYHVDLVVCYNAMSFCCIERASRLPILLRPLCSSLMTTRRYACLDQEILYRRACCACFSSRFFFRFWRAHSALPTLLSFLTPIASESQLPLSTSLSRSTPVL